MTAASVLVVDDDETFRTRLVRAFQARELEAQGAKDGDEAIALAKKESPEFAVVDLRMPGMSGLDVVRELKAIDATTNIVVLTGYGSIATALEAVRLGATHYLTKPADVDDILAAFARANRRRRSSRGHRRAQTCRRSRAPSGSTSTACSPTAAATSRRPRGCSGCIAAACSASSRSTRAPGDPRPGRPRDDMTRGPSPGAY